MSYTVPVVGVLIVAGLAGVLVATTKNANNDDESGVSSPASQEASSAQIAESSANAANSDSSNLPIAKNVGAVETAEVDHAEAEQSSEAQSVSGSSLSGASVSKSIEFAQSIGRERLDDATLNELADELRADPGKLSAVLDEFAAESDTDRLSRLRLLLGQLDDPALVTVAELMVFSGNPESSNEALKLLRDIGPDVPAAQDVGVNVLTSTQDPQLLVGATNILTSSAKADAETKRRVVTSLTSLVQHPDATVRRASFSTLARWSKDPADTPTLLQGLNDPDPTVRRSTAYGFVGYSNADASVISALLNTAENASETRRARSGAILALKSMPLDDVQTARLQAAQAQL